MRVPPALTNSVTAASKAPVVPPEEEYSAVSPVDGYPLRLPALLAQPDDHLKLSTHQALLRQNIEAFEATPDDATIHARGRNRAILAGQVGIRCRHCKNLPVLQRQRGSTYFPNSLTGIYQAVLNMNTVHMQVGVCTEMPADLKNEFVNSMCTTKKHQSGAGKQFWAESGKRLGLVDTEEDGIRFIRNVPQGSKVLETITGFEKTKYTRADK
uniref:Uncharacterized protein n=1 Tax=Entomoneis paludosa TaxID=265537 RepID=A0A7S3DXD6_9STRA|mmetsp:Transcript_5830/g.12287  ORF Transcript_5830/g.12287 Transcript_5830/m.12287 type:complete len:212 (+) Transcript_5830:1-636(+)